MSGTHLLLMYEACGGKSFLDLLFRWCICSMHSRWARLQIAAASCLELETHGHRYLPKERFGACLLNKLLE